LRPPRWLSTPHSLPRDDGCREHSFVYELVHFLDCIVNGKDVAPEAATFEDGYRAAVICDAILASAAGRTQVDVKY
jgi:predicted dehydrogenase